MEANTDLIFGQVKRSKLKGHKNEVLCLDYLATSKLLLSGSADGTARLWDTRQFSSVNCFFGPSKRSVNCVNFGRNEQQMNNRFYMASDNSIFAYDLRHTEKPLIVLNDKNIFCTFPNHKDEVNEIAVSEQGNFLASADDFGEVRVYSLADLETAPATPIAPISVFSHAKEDIICSSVRFLNETDLISGGFDSSIAKWKFSQSKALYRKNFDQDPPGAKQIFNPRYVHTVSVMDDFVAAGTGDGSLFIVKDSNQQIFSCFDAHTASGVSQVKLDKLNGKEALISAGNDHYINIWKLEFPTPVAKSAKKKRSKKNKPKPAAEVFSKCERIFHDNFIFSIKGNLEESAFFVADQGTEIVQYLL